MFSICSQMSIETLGEAFQLGWRVTARCAQGKNMGMKQIRECTKRYELDMQPLLWTRGPNFPLSRLSQRMICVRCGSREVSIVFQPPSNPNAARIA
jgi:hypothetical protein